jgi:hypothetical protein
MQGHVYIRHRPLAAPMRVTLSARRPSVIGMRPFIFAAVLLAMSAHVVSADPTPPCAGALFAAVADAGDWRLHPDQDQDIARPWTPPPLLSLDARGAHSGRSRLGLAATGVALVGALLIASERNGSWCHGARCDVGDAALLVAGPLLDAVARESESR